MIIFLPLSALNIADGFAMVLGNCFNISMETVSLCPDKILLPLESNTGVRNILCKTPPVILILFKSRLIKSKTNGESIISIVFLLPILLALSTLLAQSLNTLSSLLSHTAFVF